MVTTTALGPRVLDLGILKVTIDSDNASQHVALVSQRLEDDSEPMRKISDILVTMVKENILTGTFTPVKPETIERRRYPFLPAGGIGARMAVGGAQPLVAGRSLLNGIVPRSKKGYAAAQRGKDEWYGFLHNEGKGDLDRREFMWFSAGGQDQVTEVWSEWLGGVVEGDGQ